jgi:hypothetical protein
LKSGARQKLAFLRLNNSVVLLSKEIRTVVQLLTRGEYGPCLQAQAD